MDNIEGIRPIKVDQHPLYMQTIDALLKLIAEGYFKPGDRLPKEELLAGQFGVSRATLRVATGYLEAQGYIYRRRGSGTYVASQVRDQYETGLLTNIEHLEPLEIIAERAGVSLSLVDSSIERVTARQEWAAWLGLDERSEVIVYEITKLIDGQPALYAKTILQPGPVTEELLEDVNNGIPFVKAAKERLNAAYTRTEIVAETVDAEVRAKLGVHDEQAVLKLIETHMGKNGKPLTLAYVYLLTSHFHYYTIRKIVL